MTNPIPILKNWTLLNDKLPKYTEFKRPFTEDVDPHLADLILKTDDPRITPLMKKIFKEQVVDHIKDGKISTIYHDRHGLGRFYADDKKSLVVQSKYIKNTIYEFLGWKDFDMIKGHPNLILSVAEANGLDLPTFKEYTANFDRICADIMDHYTIPGQPQIEKDQVKWAFNMMIYGGGLHTWKTKVQEGEVSDNGTVYEPVPMADKDFPDIMKNFKRECQQVAETVFSSNPNMAIELEKRGEELWQVKNAVMSYFCQTLEMFALYKCYTFLKKEGIIAERYVALAYDGLTIPPPTKSFNESELLQKLNAFVKQQTGLSVAFKIKDFDEDKLLINLIEQRQNMASEANIPEAVNVEAVPEAVGVAVASEDTAITKKQMRAINVLIGSPTQENMAKCFNELFGDQFLYKDDVTYHFNGVFWEVAGKTAMRRVFTGSFTNVFLKLQAQATLDIANYTHGTPEHTAAKARADSIRRIVAALQTDSNILAVTKNAMPPYIENKLVKLESIPSRFCFNNCVFDLDSCEFITPKKEDYCTMSTGYDWREPTEEEMKTVTDMLKKVFPLEDERTLYLTILATGLYGKTLEKFILADGNGANAKSTINELMMSTVGGYGYSGSNATLLGPIKDGPNESVARMNNMRFIVFKEPNTSTASILNVATIKELSGGDEINARGLYSSNTVTRLKCTIVLECNERPRMGGDVIDQAIIRRLVDILFRSTFVRDEEDVDEARYYFLGDEEFKDAAFKEKHKYALFRTLIPYWREYLEKKRNLDKFIPVSVKARGEEYLKDSNEIYTWFTEIYEKVEDNTEILKLDDVYKLFQNGSLYRNYSKAQQREMTRAKFISKIKANVFIGKHFVERERGAWVRGKYGVGEVRNVLRGFRLTQQELPITETRRSEDDFF